MIRLSPIFLRAIVDAFAIATLAVSPTTMARDLSFKFSSPTGQISATVRDVPGRSMKVVVFTPFVMKTDGDMYHASLESMWGIYGKNRGLFQLNEARLEPDSGLGGNAICWPIHNPRQRFCVFPTKDEASGKIAALTVWVK